MSEHSKRLKEKHVGLMRVLHQEIREFPGGYQVLAEVCGCAPQTLINMFNPNALDQAPTLERFLDVLAVVRPQRTLNGVCALAGMAAIEVSDAGQEVTAEDAFHSLVKEAGDVLTQGSIGLAGDHRFDADERSVMLKELLELQGKTAAMISAVTENRQV